METLLQLCPFQGPNTYKDLVLAHLIVQCPVEPAFQNSSGIFEILYSTI